MGREILFLIMLGILGATGCKKNGFDCFTSTGKIIQEDRYVADFDSIDIRDYVNLVLIQDTVNKVVVEAGENIIRNITTNVIDRQLNIRNNNTCNWVRSYNKPINVYVSVKNLWKIYYQSSGNINTSNTLNSDSLKIVIWGGCGSLNLEMDINTGYFLLIMGTVDINLKGNCDICSIASSDYGFIDCRELTTGYSYIINNGSNDSYVSASQYLEATIGSIGNIYYTGNPAKVVTYINGSGRVIPF